MRPGVLKVNAINIGRNVSNPPFKAGFLMDIWKVLSIAKSGS